MKKMREMCMNCAGTGYPNQVIKASEDGTLRAFKGEPCEKCDGKGYHEYAVFTVAEAEAILAELYEKHQETGECGVYEIEDGKLGEKITDL